MTTEARTTIQIVSVYEGKETHVRKLTLSLPASRVLGVVLKAFEGHLVSRKKKAPNARDLRRK